jgi:hypothetical protein
LPKDLAQCFVTDRPPPSIATISASELLGACRPRCLPFEYALEAYLRMMKAVGGRSRPHPMSRASTQQLISILPTIKP